MVQIQYLNEIKNIDIDENIQNGDLQTKLLNFYNLTIYDINYLLYKYKNNQEICGLDNSFYSKFIINELEYIKIFDKKDNLNNEINISNLRDCYNTFLISKDDYLLVNEESNNESFLNEASNTVLNIPSNITNNLFTIPSNSNNRQFIIYTRVNNLSTDNEEELNNNTSDNNVLDTSNNSNVLDNSNNSNVFDSSNIINEQQETSNLNENHHNVINNEQVNETQSNNENQRNINLPDEQDNENEEDNIVNNEEFINNIVNTIETNLQNVLSSNVNYTILNSFISELENNITNTEEDVKIVLKEDDFKNIKIEKIKDKTCSICLEEINEECLTLPCNHYLHINCGKSWLCEYSNKCPVCKNEVFKGVPK